VCPFSQGSEPETCFEAVAVLFAGDGPGGPGELKEGAGRLFWSDPMPLVSEE